MEKVDKVIEVCIILMMMLLVGYMIVELVSATNIKSIDSLNKTVQISDHDSVIMNITRVTDLHKVILPYNTDVNNYAFELEIYNYEGSYKNWFTDMECFRKESFVSSIGDEILDCPLFYRYWDPLYLWTYEEDVLNISKGVNDYGDYNYTVVGKKNVSVFGAWLPYDAKADLMSGLLKLRGYYYVGEGETVEWIPTFAGVRIFEWADFSGSTLYEMSNFTDVHDGTVAGSSYKGQSFTVGYMSENVQINLTHVEVMVKHDGNPGDNMTVEVQGYDDAGNVPNGTVLSTGEMDQANVSTSARWSYAEMSSYVLQPDENYSIVLKCPSCSGSDYSYRQDNVGNVYTGGCYFWSSDSGSSWNINCARDGMFKIYGLPVSSGPDPLNVTVFSPTSITYDVRTISFNISTDTNFSSAVVSFDNWTTNSTMTLTNTTFATFTNNTMTDFTYHTAYFWVNDSAGTDNNTVYVSFFINTTQPDNPPTVDILSPVNDSVNNTGSQNVLCSGWDDHGFDSMYFYVDGVQNTSYGFGMTTSYNKSHTFNLPDGSYLFKCRVKDNSTQETYSSEINLTFDTIGPSVTVVSPSNTTYSTSDLQFNVTAIDSQNVSSCEYSLDSGVNNITMNQSGDSWSHVNSSMLDGSYTASFYCNDSWDNLNTSVSISFSVNTSTSSTVTSSDSVKERWDNDPDLTFVQRGVLYLQTVPKSVYAFIFVLFLIMFWQGKGGFKKHGRG